MRSKNPVPVSGTKGFLMTVMPSREYLDKAIMDNGRCDPRKCWHKVAINAIVVAWGENNSRVRVDAGHVKMNYKGWRYIADTPNHVKRGLMLFDKERYDEIRIREYNLRFRKTTKITKISAERQEQINTARLARIKAGSKERKRSYTSMHKRVVGYSVLV